jgi:hypothetical protein
VLVVCVDMVPYGLRRPNAGCERLRRHGASRQLQRIASAAKANGMGDRDTRICVQTPRNAYMKKAPLGVFVFERGKRDFLRMTDKPPP